MQQIWPGSGPTRKTNTSTLSRARPQVIVGKGGAGATDDAASPTADKTKSTSRSRTHTAANIYTVDVGGEPGKCKVTVKLDSGTTTCAAAAALHNEADDCEVSL